MLLVPTEIKQSSIPEAGNGLFATERIPAGKIVWRFVPGFDQIITVENLAEMPKVAKDSVEHFGYLSHRLGGYIICGDSGGFMNHGKYPNVLEIPDDPFDSSKAIRDIEAGEELLSNYFEYDDSAADKLGFDENGFTIPPPMPVLLNRFTNMVIIG